MREQQNSGEGKTPSRSLGEQAADMLASDLTPIDDYRSTADDRLGVVRNLVREFLAGNFGDLRLSRTNAGRHSETP